MDPRLDAVKKRYGDVSNLELLTEGQVDLLLDPPVANNTDVADSTTVRIASISGGHQPVLELVDAYGFMNMRTNPGRFWYQLERNKHYRMHSVRDAEQLSEERFRYQLRDNSRVIVEISVFRNSR